MGEYIKFFLGLSIIILASINELRKVYKLFMIKNNKTKWRRNKIVISSMLAIEFIVIPTSLKLLGDSNRDEWICNILGVCFILTVIANLVNKKIYKEDVVNIEELS